MLIADASIDIDESKRPEVDHDTKGVSGTPDIVQQIMSKIDGASVFVADMTPVCVTDPSSLRPDLADDRQPKPKHVQNSNVMTELGYAEKALGLEKVILVANAEHYPGPDALPFDWRNRRGPLTYTLADNATKKQRAAEQTSFAKKLMERLRPYLEEQQTTIATSPPRASVGSKDVWPQALDGFRMRDLFDPSKRKTYRLPDGGRLYVRVRPATWTSPGSNGLVESLRQANRAFYTGGQHGDSGPNAEGALSIWGVATEDGEGIRPTTITQWFKDDGELWGVDTGVFYNDSDATGVALDYAMPHIGRFLKNSMEALSRFGSGPYNVTIGVTGLEDTVLNTGGMWKDRYSALADNVEVEEIASDLSDDERHRILMKFWNEMRDAFGLPIAGDLNEFREQARLA